MSRRESFNEVSRLLREMEVFFDMGCANFDALSRDVGPRLSSCGAD